MKRLYLFATEREAKASLELSEDVSILITGIGPINAAAKLASVIAAYDEIISLGIAGSLKEGIEGFQPISQVSKFQIYPESYKENKRLALHQSFTPDIELASKGAKLLTVDYPLHCSNLRQSLAKQADLVDMEGWAVARVCQMHQKGCQIYKWVSDLVREDSSAQIRETIDQLSKEAAHFILRCFDKEAPTEGQIYDSTI